jgi:urease accessory protein
MTNNRAIRLVLAIGLWGAASTAFAHPGLHHVAGMAAGLFHPISGLDHILAMVAVGLWAAFAGGRSVWVLPVAFVGLMVGGAALAMHGIHLPMVESGILISVVALGLVLALGIRMPVVPAALLVGLFGVFHGYAHGLEITANASGYEYGLGFACSTMALHICGILLGQGLMRFQMPLYKVLGGVIASGGIALALFS